MGMGSPKEISIDKQFGEVAVTANGARVEIHSDGSVDAYTDRPVRTHTAEDDSVPPATGPKPGETMG
jgi:hypothetical protein